VANPGRPAACAVCATVPESRRLELDLMMGDPSRWPKAIWGVFDLPDGPNVPPVMREWGALEVGVAWLNENGWGDLNKAHVRNHYERHVTLIPQDPVAAGAAAEGRLPPDATVDPLAYLRFYMKGIEVGRKGLELLAKHVEDLQEKNLPVPLNLIKMMVDAGAKLAVSQAQIKSREKSIPDELGDEDDGFRGGGDPPGPRFGHTRIRNVAGEARPVHDEGPADRAAYNARADQEGGTKL
jgi:hypothetical protein